jgi:acyl carrier protein
VQVDEIHGWLVSKISEITGIETQEIGIWEQFAAFGVASKDAVVLSGELEDLLGCQLSPSLLYEYPSIGALSRYLTEQLENADSGQQSGTFFRQETDPLVDILAAIELLSDVEVEELFKELARTERLCGEVK